MLYAMFALILQTAIVGVLTLGARIGSVRSGAVSPRYFRLMQGDEPTGFVAQASRNYNNLFETPTLFYAAGVLHIVMNVDNQIGLICAWVYVGSRIAHTVIHLTYNHVLHRLGAYLTGNLMIMALWLNLVIASL